MPMLMSMPIPMLMPRFPNGPLLIVSNTLPNSLSFRPAFLRLE